LVAAIPVPASVRLLRTFNPLIAGVLHTPLHRFFSRDLLVLEYRGRKSGREYRKPLAYVEHGGSLYVFARKGMSDWWRNLATGTSVRVLYRGAWRIATCAIEDAKSPAILPRFRDFLTRNPSTAPVVYDVGLDAGRKPREADLAQRIGETAIVRLDLV
jgi:deazaflavin-dependent oxidoreductase (nitroreductase family)